MSPLRITVGGSMAPSVVSPSHPNQSPPRACIAAIRPTVSPPGAVPRLGSAIRLETATSLLIRGASPRRFEQEHFQPFPNRSRVREMPLGGNAIAYRYRLTI